MRLEFTSADDLTAQIRVKNSGLNEATTEAERTQIQAREHMRKTLEMIESMQSLLEDSAENIIESIRLKAVPGIDEIEHVRRCQKIIEKGKENARQAQTALNEFCDNASAATTARENIDQLMKQQHIIASDLLGIIRVAG